MGFKLFHNRNVNHDIGTEGCAQRRMDGQTETDRQTDRQTGIDRHTDTHTDKQTDR